MGPLGSPHSTALDTGSPVPPRPPKKMSWWSLSCSPDIRQSARGCCCRRPTETAPQPRMGFRGSLPHSLSDAAPPGAPCHSARTVTLPRVSSALLQMTPPPRDLQRTLPQARPSCAKPWPPPKWEGCARLGWASRSRWGLLGLGGSGRVRKALAPQPALPLQPPIGDREAGGRR